MTGVRATQPPQSPNAYGGPADHAEPHIIVKLTNMEDQEDELRVLYNIAFTRSDEVSEQVRDRVIDAMSAYAPSLSDQLRREPVFGFRRVFESMSWADMERLASMRVEPPVESTVPKMPDLRTYFRIDFRPPRPERGRPRDTRSALDRYGMTAEDIAGQLVQCQHVERAHVGCRIGEPPSNSLEAPSATDKPSPVPSEAEVEAAVKSAQHAIGLDDLQKLYSDDGGKTTRADGRHTRYVDIEQGWEYRHPQLPELTGLTPISGVNRIWKFSDSQRKWTNVGLHGLMTLGLISGQKVGIAPKATPYVASEWKKPPGQPWTENTAEAIIASLKEVNTGQELKAGDVIVIQGQQIFDGKHLPVEADPLIFDAIVTAYHLGIIVVEAAGNNEKDAVNLDTVSLPPVIHGRPRTGFDPDSGAIVVGAGENVDTTGNGGAQKFGYRKTSNYGTRVDCFADGDNILALDLPGPAGNVKGDFEIVPGGGTSSATAIIAGIALVLQGIYRDEYGDTSYIHPWEMRKLLKDNATGIKPVVTGQAGAVRSGMSLLTAAVLFRGNGHTPNEPASPIGVMPNLSRIFMVARQFKPIADKQTWENVQKTEDAKVRVAAELGVKGLKVLTADVREQAKRAEEQPRKRTTSVRS